jgi:endonuclease-3
MDHLTAGSSPHARGGLRTAGDLTQNTDPVKAEQDLIKIIPREHWISFSHQIILHGRAVCVARNPRCAECGLNDLCYAGDKTV